MKQSKLMSFVETFLSTLIGLGVALATQIVVFPLFGWSPPLSTNLAITAIFTLVSIARQFLVRRLFEALHIRTPMSPFLLAVAAERRRQIEVEGWAPEHDDRHVTGELAHAGACYALHPGPKKPTLWKWDARWWKPTPKDYRRQLVKATALLVAEGEKFDRTKTKRRASA